MKNPMDNIFCESFRTMAMEHLTTCETCRTSIAILFQELPFLGTLVGSENKEKINAFLKGVENGRNQENG